MERKTVHGAASVGPEFGEDEVFRPPAEVIRFARLCGASDCPVVLVGETGSGKTHVARLIHRLSRRSRMPFVRVNSGSIPETLFEREMFGHVRGAFTGAHEGRPGYLEEAHRGTLFLDEVGELPLAMQSKLLTVLDDGVFRRLGSTRETIVDLRIVAATNRDIQAMVAGKSFREDLFYRLSVIQYRVPPLREHPEVLPRLVHHLLRRHAGNGAPTQVSDEALAVLVAHPWPGNIRELENVLRSALVFGGGGTIEPDHLPAEIRSGARWAAAERYAAPLDPGAEEAAIREALAAAAGNKTVAARSLGMARSTLWAKLRQYGS